MPIIGAGTGTNRQPQNFRDLYIDLMNRVRTTTGVTATETQAQRYINIALQDMHVGFDYKFPWNERRDVITTRAPYITGTVSIPVGSTTLTGSSTAWNTVDSYGIKNARVGGKIIINSVNQVYEVTAVSDDTTITLNSPYVADSDASALTYTYFEDEYALADDFLRPVDARLFSIEYNLPLIGRNEFRQMYPRIFTPGLPRVTCIVDLGFLASNPQVPIRKLRMYPYPDRVYRIPYSYISNVLAIDADGTELTGLVGDTDEPVVPLRYRHVIILHALYNWYRDKRDDARSQEAKAEYTDLMQRIVNDQDIGTHVKAHIQPRTNWYAYHAMRPYSKRGGKRMDLNNEFDYFRR